MEQLVAVDPMPSPLVPTVSARPVVLAAHGTADPQGLRTLEAIRDAVADRLGVAVTLGFVDVASPSLDEVLVGTPGALVVPLFVTGGYHVEVDVPAAASAGARAIVTDHLGAGAALASALLASVREVHPAPQAIALLAAGSSRVSARAEIDELAAHLAGLAGVPVAVGFLTGSGPTASAALEQVHGAADAVAVPALLAPGLFATRAAQLADMHGIRIAPVLGAQPAVIDLIVDRVATWSPRLAAAAPRTTQAGPRG